MTTKKKPQAKKRDSKKKGATWPEEGAAESKPNGHAGPVTTVPSNGSLPETHTQTVEDTRIPIGEAMRRAVEELGERTIDTDLAAAQMAELAGCYEDVVRRQAAYTAKAEEAKTAKKSLESATEMVLQKIRAFTHGASLPLFDSKEREDDHADMLAAGEVDDATAEEQPGA